MKKQLFYSAPVVEIIEVAIENGIAGSNTITPGTPGEVIYDPDQDNYDF